MTFVVDVRHACVYNAGMAGIMADDTVRTAAEAARIVAGIIIDIDDGDPVPALDSFDTFPTAGAFRRFLRLRMPGLLAAYDRKVVWARQEAEAIARSLGATEGRRVQDALAECSPYLANGNVARDWVVKWFHAGRRAAGRGPSVFRRHDWEDVDLFYKDLLSKDPDLSGVTTVTELVRLLPEEMGIKRTAFYPWLKHPKYTTPSRLLKVVERNKLRSRSANAQSSSPRKR